MEARPEPMDRGRLPSGPQPEPSPVIAKLEKRLLRPAQAQALRGAGGHAEDDLLHRTLHGMPLSWRGDPEVLAHRRARARHRDEDDRQARVDPELLGHRPVVHRVLGDDREPLPVWQRHPRRLAARGVRQLEHGDRPQGGAGREQGRGPEHPPARADGAHLGLSPFSAKYRIAPGWNGMGEPPWYWIDSSRLAASECTATRSAFFSKTVFTIW